MLGDVEPPITFRNGQNYLRTSTCKILVPCWLFCCALGKTALRLVATDTAECRLPPSRWGSRQAPVLITRCRSTLPCGGHTVSIQPLHLVNKSISLPTNLRLRGMLTPVMQATRCTTHPVRMTPLA
jgi:hypothetical protein